MSSYKKKVQLINIEEMREMKNYHHTDTTIISVAGLINSMDAEISRECLRRNKIFHSPKYLSRIFVNYIGEKSIILLWTICTYLLSQVPKVNITRNKSH